MNESLSENSLRNAVLTILTAKYPLSARELYETIKCDHVKLATYPAVYKTLKVMTRESKLIKQNRSFLINIEWVKDLRKFAEKVEEEYVQKMHLPNLDEIKENDSHTLKFSTLTEADSFRKRFQMQYFGQAKQPSYCAFYNHLRSPVVYSERSFKGISAIQGTRMKCFLVVKGNTAIDKWCADFYTSDKLMFAVTGADTKMDVSETLILGDVIVQMYIDKRIEALIDDIYKKAKTIDSINVPEFYKKTYEKHGDVKFVIFRNTAVAEQLRQQALSFFRNAKK